MGKARYYTNVALASGFHQIHQIVKKLAFSTPGGQFYFRNTRMGICSASDTFQRLMNTVLSGLVGIKARIYLDDTVIWGATLVEHKDW
jgi:hypothetical protein